MRVRKAPEDEAAHAHRIVLGCADGESGTMIAQRLGTTVANRLQMAAALPSVPASRV